jgi:PEP-CTERM motif
MRRCVAFAVSALFLMLGTRAEAGFITNGSFETVPGTGSGFQGQGLLPTGWATVNSSPDTYSNDGSYGLPPNAQGLGNFTGVTAFDGIRWVAGASFGRVSGGAISSAESFGTTLTAALTPGQTYELDAELHQALRSDLNNPGAYDVYLASGNTPSGIAGAELLGSFAPTTSAADWEARSVTFVAPANAGSRLFLFLVPYQASGTNSYTGLDALSLTQQGGILAAPEPATVTLLGVGGISCLAVSWRKRGTRLIGQTPRST